MGTPFNGQGSPDTRIGIRWNDAPRVEDEDGDASLGDMIGRRNAARFKAYRDRVRKNQRI